MPEASQFETPQGNPLHEVQFRAITEGLVGNGVVNAGDLELTAGAGSMEIDAAAGTVFYIATEHSYAGAAPAVTLSAGDPDDDRWDTIAFDTSTDSVVAHEGTPAANPTAQDISGAEILLGVVYVAAGATDVGDSNILNWRAMFSNEAEHVHYDDGTGVYSVDNVDAALDELQEAAQIGAYPLALADLDSPFPLPSITNMDVDGTDLTDAATLLYESANGWFRNEVVQGLANLTGDEQFTGHPVDSPDIGTDAITDTEIDLTISPTWTGVHTFDSALVMAEVTTPSAAPAGYNRVYFKSDDLLYKMTEGGSEETVGALITEDDQTEVVAATKAISAEAGLSISDDGDGTVSLDYEHAEVFEGRETGSVPTGDQGLLVIDHLADGETVEVYKAVLVNSDGTAVASSVDLKLVTLDNAGGFTSRATLITGDGASVFDDETGSPLGSHTNSSGGGQTIAVLVDNGSGGSVDIVAVAEGVTGA